MESIADARKLTTNPVYRGGKFAIVLVAAAVMSFGAVTVAQASTTAKSNPTPAASATVSAACAKVYTEVTNADKVYVAYQYGIVQAAKNYLANSNLTNVLLYNDSVISALKAAGNEYTIAVKNPSCFNSSTVSSAAKNIKTNTATVTSIQSYSVAGKPVGTPKSWLTYKPVGLYK